MTKLYLINHITTKIFFTYKKTHDTYAKKITTNGKKEKLQEMNLFYALAEQVMSRVGILNFSLIVLWVLFQQNEA